MACEASEQIEVVDSRPAGGRQALLALSAARWAGEMSDHRKVARRVERSIERNHGLVTVDTLKYLAMGGRIGKVQAPVVQGAVLEVEFRHGLGIIYGIARQAASVTRQSSHTSGLSGSLPAATLARSARALWRKSSISPPRA